MAQGPGFKQRMLAPIATARLNSQSCALRRVK